jgi:tRNA (guanine37-N1)-methyltransferase
VSLSELDVFTLFPEWFAWLEETRPVQRATAEGLRLRFRTPREYGLGRHRAVDDAPFGGGAGMVLRVDVMVAGVEGVYGAPLEEVRRERRIVALDPGGRPFDDAYARELAAADRVTLLSGRYEGFDHRILEHVATESLSLGPFVLAGGEAAAMTVCDAVCRLLPGALGAAASSEEESFSPALGGALEYPHYTRPEEFRGWRVPEVLVSGDHGKVASWRAKMARERRADDRSRL